MNKNNGWTGRTIAYRKGIFGEVEVYNANTPEGNMMYNSAIMRWNTSFVIVAVGALISGLSYIGLKF
jgi:hypothetical protein